MNQDDTNKITRRRLLAFAGAAGLGLAIPASLGMENVPDTAAAGPILAPGLRAVSSADEIRAIAVPDEEQTLLFLAEPGKEGLFFRDAADAVSADNTGTVIVAATGARYKRFLQDGSVNAAWFGAKGDKQADDTQAIQAALNSGAAVVVLPAGDYLVTSALTLPPKICLYGQGTLTNLVKRHDGFLIAMEDQSQLQELRLAGSGGQFKGGGVQIDSGSSQKIVNCAIVDTESYCIEYTKPKAGSISTIQGCLLSTAQKTKLPAVKYPDDETNGDRKLLEIDCDGGLLADFAGCSTVLVTNCNTVGVLFRKQSKKVSLISNRLAGGSLNINVEIWGKNHVIVGNVSATPFYLGEGTTDSVIVGNLALVYDRSGVNTNNLSSNMSGLEVSGQYGKHDKAASKLLIGAGGDKPDAASIAFGDGTGWKLNFGTSRSNAFFPLVSMHDTGGLSIAPSDSVAAPKGALFVDQSDGKLKFKDRSGTVRQLY